MFESTGFFALRRNWARLTTAFADWGASLIIGACACPLWVVPGHSAGAIGMSAFTHQRLSEYPTDHYVGICIETSAMAEQNTLRLPQVNFSDCRLRLLPLEE